MGQSQKRFKKLPKPPFLCLILFLFVLLGALVFYSKPNLTPFLTGDFSFSANVSISQLSSQNLFAQAQNISKESPEMTFIQRNSLARVASPAIITPQILGMALEDEESGGQTREEIIEYIVKSGDSFSSIAAQFDISVNTILWANELTNKSVLKKGQRLIILPASGVIHYAAKGDTISGIAQTYKAKSSEIIAFNNLSGEGDIYIGDILIIPNGQMPIRTSTGPLAVVPQIPTGEKYFIPPVSFPYIITQGLHWYNAIDFSHQSYACGKQVFAAAGGTVRRVVRGGTGYGNYITILHPNGVVTLYAHLNGIFVSSGQSVSQGTPIGLIGNTGYTIGATGCHLHFEVRGARNPFAR